MSPFKFVTDLRFSPLTGQWLAHNIEETIVWHNGQAAPAYRLPGPLIGISQDGGMILTGRKEIHLAASDTGEPLKLTPKVAVQFALGQRLWVRTMGFTVYVYNPATPGQPKKLDFSDEFKPAPGVHQALGRTAVSPNGRAIAVTFEAEGGGFETSRGSVFDMEGKRLYRFSVDHNTLPMLHFTANPNVLAVSSNVNYITLYDGENGRVLQKIRYTDTPKLAVRPDSEPLMFVYRNGRSTWHLVEGDHTLLKANEKDRIQALAFTDANSIGVLLVDGTLNVYTLDAKLLETYYVNKTETDS